MKEMTCREFDEIVHAFVRMELLDVNVREAALEHAAHCDLCSQRMVDAAASAERFPEMMGKTARGEQTPGHVEASLLVAFRSHHRQASWRRTLEWGKCGSCSRGAADFSVDSCRPAEGSNPDFAEERYFVAVEGSAGCESDRGDSGAG